ncbi:MAG: HAMP domain-containing protein, partial [Methylococcaceae bacterium]|nr:HAMP domain-containing protein [Methylococcaceae bacterium]
MGAGHFRSKVARRIFVSFVLAALIPAGVLSSLLYVQVREQLREQTVDHLHQEVKGYGIDILERLATMVQTLRSLAVLVNGKGANLPAFDSPWVREQFAAVLWLKSGRSGLPLLNDIPDFPDFSEAELAGRLGGKPGIWLRHRQDGRCEVFMLLPVSEGRPELGVLAAQLNPATLWNTDTVEPDAIWIFADGGELVFASEQAPVPRRRQLNALLGRQSGYVAWREGKQALAAASWPLFLESRFAADGWTIVLIRAEPGRVLVNDRLAFVYAPVAALLLLGVAYVSSRLIRRQLNPIAQLTAATARVAEGDFDQRVQIATDDEFQRLAESFNHMAGRIRDQWAAAAAMAEIDRTILSSLSAERVIETVLERMPAVLQCDVLCLARFDHAARCFYDIRASRDGRISVATAASAAVSDAQLEQFMAVNLMISAADLPAPIAAQGFAGSEKILALPIWLERQLAA